MTTYNAEQQVIRWCPNCQPEVKLENRRYAVVKFATCANCKGVLLCTVTAHRGPFRSNIELCVGPDRRVRQKASTGEGDIE